MLEELLKESSANSIFMDLAMEVAMKRAREEAMPLAMQEATRIAIQGRYGELAEELDAALHRADKATLSDILGHLTTDTPEQLRARLGMA
ncbi:MAG: hypothetical protein ACRDIE_18625 [Chloroflexota bacterium]